MKKLLRNVALLLLPILLYYAVFLAFEPNNIFGLRRETPTGAVFGALRGYRQAPTPGVLLGDSRFANIEKENMELIDRVTGRAFTNLAYGGASLKESLDELDYLLENYAGLEEVVFELSYYTLNANYAADRFPYIEKALYNPFVYLTSLYYNLEALQNCLLWLQGKALYGGASETRDPAADVYIQWQTPGGETVKLRQDIADYLAAIGPNVQNWTLDESEEGQLARLLESIAACQARGIRFVVVLPPVHDAVMEYAIQANGIYEQMLPVLEALRASGAEVLDYEISGRPAYGEEMWFDGMHLDYSRGLPQFAERLAGDLA